MTTTQRLWYEGVAYHITARGNNRNVATSKRPVSEVALEKTRISSTSFKQVSLVL